MEVSQISGIRKAASDVNFVQSGDIPAVAPKWLEDEPSLLVVISQPRDDKPSLGFLTSLLEQDTVKPLELGKHQIFRNVSSTVAVRGKSSIVLSHVSDEQFQMLGHLRQLSKLLKGICTDHSPQRLVVFVTEGTSSKCVFYMLQDFLMTCFPDNRYKKDTPTTSPYLIKKFDVNLPTSLNAANFLQQPRFTDLFSGIQTTRELTNSPPNYCTTTSMSRKAVKIAVDGQMTSKILGLEECQALKMGSYLAVAGGSVHPPQFIHLTYKPTGVVKKRIAFIGKGITFDTGGYNLKLANMEIMKVDMGGSAVVLGTAEVLSKLKPAHVEIHFIIPAAENAISQTAYRPSDIITASNGKTIEVGNTDAEGRLTLADALVYAERLGVDKIVEMSTLTGACSIALGPECLALYSHDEALAKAMVESAEKSGDLAWKMPLIKMYRKNIDSKIADIHNMSSEKFGGSIHAALFLQEFVEKVPFLHCDMGLACFDPSVGDSYGHGVKMMTEFFLNESAEC